jgi:hypothetical protein
MVGKFSAEHEKNFSPISLTSRSLQGTNLAESFYSCNSLAHMIQLTYVKNQRIMDKV